jgi:hypothetical protein
LEIASDYAKRDQRITVWQNDSNKGLFANYNETMSRADGRFIKLFAQDDCWQPTMLERCAAAFANNQNIGLVATQREWIDESGNRVPIEDPFEETTLTPGRELVLDCLLRRLNMIGEPSTAMFPRSNIGSGFDVRYYHLGDLEFWFRLMLKGDFMHIHESLCTFRRHETSATNKNIKGLLFALDYFSLANQYADLVRNNGLHLDTLKVDIARDVARYVAQMNAEGVITLDELLKIHPQYASQAQVLDQFKELSLFALLAAASAEKDVDCKVDSVRGNLASVEASLNAVLDSKSWRATQFLRSAAHKLKSSITGD